MNTDAVRQRAPLTGTAALTMRTDAWWVEPLLVVLVLGGFVVYATWAALQNAHYQYQNYLSPFYSPLFTPSWWPLSPAFLVLWAPAGFRLTCYYYRKAYYRAFLWDPPACAVREPRSDYHGEAQPPLILQNSHRYFLYASTLVLAFLWGDAVHGFIFDRRFGIGVGSLVLLANAALLSLYTFSCHSFRHLVGGNLDCFSTCPVRSRAWRGVSQLNARHALWAWVSLWGVALADLYVRLVSMGVIRDVRFL
jgi:hypothetical protein